MPPTPPPTPVASLADIPSPHIPIIASSFTGSPTLGPILENGQRRALLGWTHQKDTPEGLLCGRLWCWVARGGKGGVSGMFLRFLLRLVRLEGRGEGEADGVRV